MAEFKLERFKYNWKGQWAAGTSYKRDDIVRVGGKSYVCIITHTANSKFADDLTAILPGSVPPQPQPRWTVMTSGRSFQGDWVVDTNYNLGDIIKYNGSLWLCTTSHTASNFATQYDNWEVFAQGTGFVNDWTSGTTYAPGAIVKYNGITYKCVTPHISEATLEAALGGEDSSGAWVVFHEGVEVRNEFEAYAEYRQNDFVKYGGSVYRCLETHTAGTVLDDTKFSIEVFGSQYDGVWDSQTNYNIGDIVRHRGFMYYAVNNNTNSRPYDDNQSEDWVLLARNYNFVGTWSPITITVDSTIGLLKNMSVSISTGTGRFEENTKITSIVNTTQFTISKLPTIALNGASVTATLNDTSVSLTSATSESTIYKTGDIVLRGGNLYLALRDISEGFDDGSTLDYLDETIWELLVPGKSFKGTWTSGDIYSLNDVVYFRGSVYTCNTEHEASYTTAPEDNGSGYFYWDLLIQSGRPAGLTTKGDLLTFGPSRQIDNDGSTVYDDSTKGDTRVPIGTTDQLLSITSELDLYWRNIVVDAEQVYVATNGIDDDGRGTYEQPFRSIRYACEHVEDTYEPLTPVIIKVSTGKYEEIGPIIIPAGCAVNGDELRSTTVLASPAIPAYKNDYDYTVDYLTYFTSIVYRVITGVAIVPQTGNTKEQEIARDIVIIDPLTGQQRIEPSNFPVSNLEAADIIANSITDYKDFVEFNILSGDVSPVMTGSNTINSSQTVVNAGSALKLNRKFLEQEIISYLKNEYPDITFDERKIKNDFWSILRGLIRDVTYPGNYGALTAARRYSNAVNGSEADNLFLVRDTTGLRDLTTGGLKGILNPPGVFDLYQKPTGGACVGLDAGWGPKDERCWIINRSPYIQGVTNTGTSCVGQKIDGALHNGGNKSMVSNDFTQVLSDGIGVWVLNNARAELVSVFTYYCQIGYFAEDGGVIRAANGNNSYGRYGSIADGVDDTEIPQPAIVMNRNNQAQVLEAFAGGATDELIAFEYSNAGENYTTATASITGAGANASVDFTDFRDGAIFEARLTSPDGSSAGGGAGYTLRQGSAQETIGAASTIKLSTNDITQFLSEIEGCRIIITDGTGVGQYGVIDGFDFVSKVVDIVRDSDGVAGWDHIIPGTPLAVDLDPTTRYRIEPRITVTSPGYSAETYDLFTNRTFIDAAFGNTTRTYSGVSTGSVQIWRDDNLDRILVDTLISDIAIQVSADLLSTPSVPFNIKGRTSGATATVTSISANTGKILELDVESGGSNFIIGEQLDLVFVSGSGSVFDDAPIAAQFTITARGLEYALTLTNPGAGYRSGNKLTILGTALGGDTPANDVTITITGVTTDSTSSIQSFTFSGVAKTGIFVALTDSEYYRYSTNGQNWTEQSLPFIGSYKTLITGNNRFLALASGESRISSSLNGINWSTVNLPISASWSDGFYAGGKFVLIADDTDQVLNSTNGSTWTVAGSIPNDAVGDSTISQWTKVTCGNGKFVAVSKSDRATATSADGITWIRHDNALPDEDWTNIASFRYGNSRYLLVSAEGLVTYSFDGITWYAGTTITGLDSIATMKYSQGLFFATGRIAGASTTEFVTSEDGLIWTTRSFPASQLWSAVSFGNVNGTTKWVVLATAASTDGVAHVRTGATAKLRADVQVGKLNAIKIWNPGSAYVSAPTITITDPNFTSEATAEARIGDGVLSQPEFNNRGAGYRRSTSTITITGDGYADIIPAANKLTISGVEKIPGPGVQIEIDGVFDVVTDDPSDLYSFSGVTVTDLGDDGTGNETRLVELTISPRLETYLNVQHGTSVSLRERFSQCRISGHDFLDIGTGNFTNTNYPDIYAGGNFFAASPENEVVEANQGKVFYVSTDQDGNFRTGELFAVQQSTGIVTISAQFFDLDGLSELALGGVRLGGSGAVVNEFSTDATFAADSNNVVPTQRAIASFLADRLSVGGESLEVNRLQAGRVILGGGTNEISTISGSYLQIPSDVNFDGTFTIDDGEGNITTAQTEISGTIISQMLFLKGFDDTMQ